MALQIELTCPHCGQSVFTVADTITMRDGTRKRYRKCATCTSDRSITTREIPEGAYQRLLKLANG